MFVLRTRPSVTNGEGNGDEKQGGEWVRPTSGKGESATKSSECPPVSTGALGACLDADGTVHTGHTGVAIGDLRVAATARPANSGGLSLLFVKGRPVAS
ncbi:hypothetical protein SRM_01357 [Salinibacter ruber M8]|uniref:Uncharacterized protein n=1 Tax=Salinibacter ruber (strain M8) TaxID=761659 RepID=D5H8C3_SALRM|nr:hypothetical protein SRM_01357 [Salinibacter ruber M8]